MSLIHLMDLITTQWSQPLTFLFALCHINLLAGPCLSCILLHCLLMYQRQEVNPFILPQPQMISYIYKFKATDSDLNETNMHRAPLRVCCASQGTQMSTTSELPKIALVSNVLLIFSACVRLSKPFVDRQLAYFFQCKGQLIF